MARINTPFQQNNIAPDESGPGTFWPWLLDLTTLSGYKQFDVAIAANFRITSWHLSGTMNANVLGVDEEDTFDETIPASLNPGDVLFGNESDFAAAGTLEEASPGIPRNARLRTDTVEFVDMTQILIVGAVAFVRMDFRRGPGANTGLEARSTGDGSITAPEIGELTIRVPSWPEAGWHELVTPIYNFGEPLGIDPSADFTLTGTTSLTYPDLAANQVWSTDGTPLLNPVLASA